jgi:hypothetical protein
MGASAQQVIGRTRRDIHFRLGKQILEWHHSKGMIDYEWLFKTMVWVQAQSRELSAPFS